MTGSAITRDHHIDGLFEVMVRISLFVAALFFVIAAQAMEPSVSVLRAAQIPGTKTVEIEYSATGLDEDAGLSLIVSDGDAVIDTVGGLTAGTNQTVTWDASGTFVDENTEAINQAMSELQPSPPAPPGMVAIPAGSFQMGDHFNEGWDIELPVHTVHICAFHMDRYHVTKALWDEVYEWATDPERGPQIYSFDYAGSGKAANHPVHTINWYDMVKWCNARSEMERLTPAYYTSSDRTLANVYRTDRVDIQNDWVRWDSGYRLPTEAEWEYAARGGLEGKRFPWGDRIDHDKANYSARGGAYDYDDGPEGGVYHPKGLETGSMPYTTPVDYFEPNNFNLYDMAGNVWNWTWDWSGEREYDRGTVTNPRGPSQGSLRVIRGGSSGGNAHGCRVAGRGGLAPGFAFSAFGFRAVLPPGPAAAP